MLNVLKKNIMSKSENKIIRYSLNLRLQINYEDCDNSKISEHIINLFTMILKSSFFKKNKIELVWHDGGEEIKRY